MLWTPGRTPWSFAGDHLALVQVVVSKLPLKTGPKGAGTNVVLDGLKVFVDKSPGKKRKKMESKPPSSFAGTTYSFQPPII